MLTGVNFLTEKMQNAFRILLKAKKILHPIEDRSVGKNHDGKYIERIPSYFIFNPL
jgi:hypothetical protein